MICHVCGEEILLPAKGSLYIDDEGKSYRVTAWWLHIGKLTAHTAYMQTQHPSGGEGQTFLSLLPESARLVWSPS